MMPQPPPRRPKVKVPGTVVARIRSQRLCDDCCKDIHVRGQAVAPYPRLARWRISTADSLTRVCERHKEERVNERQ
jgi:hypothetical protein